MLKKIIVARHHGFCMGVERAIEIAEDTATKRGGQNNVTILNEIVHNEAVVEKFRRQGVGQALSVDDVADGILIISAHGISPDVVESAERKGLEVVDATCPLVSRIYRIISKAMARGLYIIHYGDPHHDETAGIVGHAPDRISVAASHEELLALPDWSDRQLGLTVQTTAHAVEFEEVEKLAKRKWPHIEVFNTICNATTRRQEAIMELAPQVEMILVVGSQTSANSKRLARISDDACGRGELIGSAKDIREEWFAEDSEIESVGVSAGASTPQFLVDDVIECLVRISGGQAEVIRLVPEERDKKLDSTAG